MLNIAPKLVGTILVALMLVESSLAIRDSLPDYETTGISAFPKDTKCETKLGSGLYAHNRKKCDICTGVFYGSVDYYQQCMNQCFQSHIFEHCNSVYRTLQ